MGQTLGFHCTHCDFAACVTGGGARGMIASTITIYCKTCRTLQDVVTAQRDMDETFQERPIRCRRAKSHPFHLWRISDPCPRCGGTLAPTGEEILWD